MNIIDRLSTYASVSNYILLILIDLHTLWRNYFHRYRYSKILKFLSKCFYHNFDHKHLFNCQVADLLCKDYY